MPCSHAAVALQIFLLVASFHIPPTTFPPSLSLPLSPPISRPCAPWFFTPSTRHTDLSLIQATGKARKWVLPFFQRVVEYASCSATVKADLRVRDENPLELCGMFYSLHRFVWIYSLPLLKLGYKRCCLRHWAQFFLRKLQDCRSACGLLRRYRKQEDTWTNEGKTLLFFFVFTLFFAFIGLLCFWSLREMHVCFIQADGENNVR